MADPKLKQLLDSYASAVAAVAVEDSKGNPSIGSAFHIGEGVFVTARHVVKDMRILSVATKRSTFRLNPDKAGERIVAHGHGPGKLIGDPMLHPDESADVALLRVEGIDAPAISLGAHLDDWLGDGLTLCSVLVMGYPPIPCCHGGLLVAAIGEVNAVADKYRGGHPHFIISTMARGGFSGGPVITEYGSALGLVTESLTFFGQPVELGYHAVLTVEPIYNCLLHYDVMPKLIHDQWRPERGKPSFWEGLKNKDVEKK